MVPIRRIYWLWLALGIAVLGYGLYTGGGLAGLLLYWELETFHRIFPDTHLLLAIPLVLFPFIALLKDADRHRRPAPLDLAASTKRLGKRFLIAGLILALGAGLCYWRTTFFPDPHADPRRIVLDDFPPTADVPDQRAILVGIPQRTYNVHYEEVMRGQLQHRLLIGPTISFRSLARTGPPISHVRFLVDTHEYPFSLAFSIARNGGGRYLLERGLLLHGQLRLFVVRALRKKGLRIADDAMILSPSEDFGRTPWLVAGGLPFSIGALFALANWGDFAPLALALSRKDLRFLRPQNRTLHPRSPSGSLIILLSLGLAVHKPRCTHRLRSQKPTAISPADSQESSHSVGRYSFWVDFDTPSSRLHSFAYTWTPFLKEVGDKVLVLYDPRRSEKTGNPGFRRRMEQPTRLFSCPARSQSSSEPSSFAVDTDR